MNAALIYRYNSRWLIWIAFACAIMIHVAAIALAENKSQIVSPDFPSGDEVIGVIDPSSPPAQEPEIVALPEPVVDETEFSDENVTAPPPRPRKKVRITPIRRSIGTGMTAAIHGSSVKALTTYAPRPAYPYEARRGGITGSGIAQLTVNPEVGNVVDAHMAQTTGSPILDNATLEALRRWRFKSGTAANIQVPITYTLTGVSY